MFDLLRSQGKNLDIAILSVVAPLQYHTGWRGVALAEQLLKCGHKITDVIIIEDNPVEIREQIQEWIEEQKVDLVLSVDDSGDEEDDLPPDVSVFTSGCAAERFTSLVHDEHFGFIGIVDIRMARDRAASLQTQ